MKTLTTWKNRSIRAFAAAAVALLFAGAAHAADVTVDCTGGPADFASVTDALNALDLQGPHRIILLPGPCNERIHIVDRERLTIDASPHGTTFVSPETGEGIVIYIANSRGIVLRQVGAFQGLHGVVIERASEVALEGCTFNGNAANGVIIQGKSLVTAPNNAFVGNENNGVVVRGESVYLSFANLHDGNGNIGMSINEGATAIVGDFTPGGGNNFNGNGRRGIACLRGCTLLLNSANGFANNGFAGLTIATGSRAAIDGSGGANEFRNNGNGVLVFFGSEAVFLGPNTIHDNTGVGVEADENSSLFLDGLAVQNNGQGGVNALRTSTAGFGSGNAISGNGGANLSCDSTALVYGELAGITNIQCARIERSLGPPRPGRPRE
jgi:hypothetical protein